MKKMKLSIITVVYNNFNCIEDTILNVIGVCESRLDIEYIIIDGGSTDGTLEIIKSYHDKITQWITEPDKGIYDAMNKGINLAKGEWLIFMNSGDLFHSNGNQFLNLNFLDNENVIDYDIIYGNTLTKNEKKIINIPQKKIDHYYFFLETICHQSIFFSRNVFTKLGNYNLDYKIIADRELLFRVAKSKGRFHHINQIISIWDEEGFSKDNIKLFKMEEKLFVTKNFGFIERLFLNFRNKLISGLKKMYIKL